MPKSRIIPIIGLFLGLQPILFGFPKTWEDFFQVVGGLGIVVLSVLISLDKRLTQKAKAERRLMARRARAEKGVGEIESGQNFSESQSEPPTNAGESL